MDRNEYYRKWNKDNPNSRKLTKRKNRLKQYGLTVDAYNKMLFSQGQVCAICKKEYESTLSVDHCHTTGVVRGLLCSHCNMGLGHFKDDPELLQKAIEYLNKESR